MRLAATLTTLDSGPETGLEGPAVGRASPRQPVALRGTLRDRADAPSEIAIVDISESGFLAELPDGTDLPIETRVRIAATMLGSHEAVVVRRDGNAYGFAFARTIEPALIEELDGEQPSTVTPFPRAARPVPAAVVHATGRLSPRVSLALMVGISITIWAVLAAIVAGIAILG